MIYIYVMRSDTMTLGEYPKEGFLKVLINDFPEHKGMNDVLFYDRKLTDKEVKEWDLLSIGGFCAGDFLQELRDKI